MQLLAFQILPNQKRVFLDLFKGLQVLEMDVCDLDMDSMKAVLLNQPLLHTFRCPVWLHSSALNLATLQLNFRSCSLQLSKQSIVIEEDRSVTLAANLLADYADFSCSLWSHLSVA